MKKFFIIIILTFPLLWEDVQAQSTVTASREETFYEDFGQKLLIRANPNDNNNPLIYYVTASNIGRKWYFLYHSLNGSGNAYKFLWPTYANSLNSKALYVHDMVILGNFCYFCGTDYYPSETYFDPEMGWTYLYDSIGFVGRISLNKINNPTPSIAIQVHDVGGTKNLTKLDATVYSGDTILALVGMSSTTGMPPALVLYNKFTAGWKERVYPLDNPDEIVTDVIFTQEQLVTVSLFRNEHFSFGLRREDISSVQVGNPNLYNYNMLIKYNTYNMTGPNSPNPKATWHPKNITALLSCIPGSDTVTVAYQCIDSLSSCPNSMYQTALFQIICDPYDNLYRQIYNAQLVSNNLNINNYTFVDMMYIPHDKTTALLHYNVTNSLYGASILQFASWNTLDDYIPNLLTDHQDYRSLNVFQNKYFYLTGASQSDSTIMYFRQNQQYSNSQPSYSCYATRPLSYSRSLTGGSWEFIHTVIPKVDPKDFTTNSNNIVGTQTRRITSCNIVTEQ